MKKVIQEEATKRYPLWGAPLQFAAFCSGARFTFALINKVLNEICDNETLSDGEVLDELVKRLKKALE